MRVLLINSNRYRDPLPVMPMGLCAVASALEEAGHAVKVLDLCFALQPKRRIEQAVQEEHPDLVGVSVRNIDNCAGFKPLFLLETTRREVTDPLKEAFKGPIVLGGPSMGISGAECLRFFDLPWAICGDGERSMVELARQLSLGQEPSGIAGLVVRRGGAIVEENAPEFIDDLDRLPRPRPQRHLDIAPYRLHGTPYQVQTKRGCPLTCSYCTYRRLEGERYRLRAPSAVADEVEEFVRETGVRQVEIVDSTFNAPLDHAKACLRALIDKKLDLRLSSMGLNPRFMDDELAQLMKAAGFMEACFGVEAGDDAMLAALGKNYTVEHVEAAARSVRRARIPALWFLLLGAPGETLGSVRRTLRTIDRVARPFDLVNIGIGVRLYKGSRMSDDWAKAHGRPQDDFLEPRAFVPDQVPLARIKAEVARQLVWRHNWFMFEDQAQIPLPFRVFFNFFFPRHPIWRGYIAMRVLEKVTGLFLLRMAGNWWRYRAARD